MKAKKLLALLLTVLLALSLSATAFAADEGTGAGTGTITITNPIEGVTYYAYKIFDVTYDLTSSPAAYSYTISETSEWWSTVLTYMGGESTEVDADDKGVYTGKGITLTPAAVDNTKYVVTVTTDGETTEKFDPAAFAKALGESVTITDNTPSPTPDATLNSDNKYTASGLELGYYFVYSGGYADGTEALFSLDTTNPTAAIRDKNQLPTIAKGVSNEENATNYVEEITASIGDTVYYQVTITTEAGLDADGNKVAQNYVLHDTMSAGLTFGGADNVKVVRKTTKDGTPTEQTLTAWSESTSTGDYKVTSPSEETEADKCSFEIAFSDTFLETLTAYDQLVITYSATVDADAATPDDAGATWTETNSAILSYKKDNNAAQLTAVTTTVALYSFDLIKTGPALDTTATTGEYQTTDGATTTYFNQLDGATFKLYSDEACTNEVSLFKVEGENGKTYYRPAVDDEEAVEIEAGQVEIRGLAAGTYYLVETEAPAGYNLLNDEVTVTLQTTIDDVTTGTSLLFNTVSDTDTTLTGGIQVENSTGAELPSTGGVGATIFYVVGAILVAGAVILLVTKRRMNGGQD